MSCCKTLKKEMNLQTSTHQAAGIVSLLSLAGKDGGFFPEKPPRSESLRRTVSAHDVIISSKYLMKQYNSKEDAAPPPPPPPPPPMANDEISVNSGPTSDNEEEDDDKKPSQMDIWSSIQSNKEVAASATALLSSAPAPKPQYVHPLVRRNSSSLSEKSLEMCTESLGSETGSDCPFSFSSVLFEDDHHGPPPDQEEEAPPRTVKYNCSVSRRLPAKPFPPPLTSISRRDGGPCLHMQPHRRNGRLVLQAVSVRSHSYLHAERHDGRLLLSFISTPEEDEEESVQEQDQSADVAEIDASDCAAAKDEIEGDEEEEEISIRDTWWRKEAPVVAEVHRSIGQAAHRPMVMNMNPWATKTEKSPSPDRALGLVGARVANGLNVYEYCWRSGGGLGQRDVKQLGKRPSRELASPAARCFEPRRAHTLWILERYCVATS